MIFFCSVRKLPSDLFIFYNTVGPRIVDELHSHMEAVDEEESGFRLHQLSVQLLRHRLELRVETDSDLLQSFDALAVGELVLVLVQL